MMKKLTGEQIKSISSPVKKRSRVFVVIAPESGGRSRVLVSKSVDSGPSEGKGGGGGGSFSLPFGSVKAMKPSVVFVCVVKGCRNIYFRIQLGEGIPRCPTHNCPMKRGIVRV